MNDRELLEFIAAQVGNLTKDVADIKQDISKINMRIENDINPNIKMCLNEIVSIKEKQTEHDQRFDNLEAKVDNHDIEIKVIKGGKIS